MCEQVAQALCFAWLAIVAKLSFSPTFMGSPHCFVLCLVGDCGKIVIFAIFANFATFANFYGPPHCFMLCLVGDLGKIVIFAIFAKFATSANLNGPSSLLCALPWWRLWQNCHFRHICQFANIFSFLPFLLLRAVLDISHVYGS